jgi:hypothetical protein
VVRRRSNSLSLLLPGTTTAPPLRGPRTPPAYRDGGWPCGSSRRGRGSGSSCRTGSAARHG